MQGLWRPRRQQSKQQNSDPADETSRKTTNLDMSLFVKQRNSQENSDHKITGRSPGFCTTPRAKRLSRAEGSAKEEYEIQYVLDDDDDDYDYDSEVSANCNLQELNRRALLYLRLCHYKKGMSTRGRCTVRRAERRASEI